MDWYPGKMIKEKLSGQRNPLFPVNEMTLSKRIAADVEDERKARGEYGELAWTLRINGLVEDADMVTQIRYDEERHQYELARLRSKIEELERTGKLRIGA